MRSPTIIYYRTPSSALRRLNVERFSMKGASKDKGRLSLVEVPNFSADPRSSFHVVSSVLGNLQQNVESILVGIADENNGVPLRRLANLIVQWKAKSFRTRLGQSSSRVLATRVESIDFLLEAAQTLHPPFFGDLFMSLGKLQLTDLEGYVNANAIAILREGLKAFLCNSALSGVLTFGIILDYQETLFFLISSESPAKQVLQGVTSALSELNYKTPEVQEVS